MGIYHSPSLAVRFSFLGSDSLTVVSICHALQWEQRKAVVWQGTTHAIELYNYIIVADLNLLHSSSCSKKSWKLQV